MPLCVSVPPSLNEQFCFCTQRAGGGDGGGGEDCGGGPAGHGSSSGSHSDPGRHHQGDEVTCFTPDVCTECAHTSVCGGQLTPRGASHDPCRFLPFRCRQLRRSSVTLRVSRPTWWCVTELQTVRQSLPVCPFLNVSFQLSGVVTSCSVSIVTGLHDVDEYIQAQLLLAVSREVCLFYQPVGLFCRVDGCLSLRL